MSEMKQRIASAEIDPEDGTARLNLEYVLIRGFAAMGWAQPTLATHELIETAAEACRDGK